MNREHENRRDDPAAFSRLARMFLWVDDMRNVNRLVWMLVTLCVVLGLLGYLTDRAWKTLGARTMRRYLRDAIKY